MKMITAVCSFCIICILCLTSLLGMNKTEESADKITTAIESQEETAPVYNNYETHNHYEQKEVIIEREVIVEKETEEESDTNASASERANESEQSTYPNLNTGSNSNTGGFRSTLECEVCEQSGTELEVWYDSNGVKHYTCKNKCTNGLDALYGK